VSDFYDSQSNYVENGNKKIGNYDSSVREIALRDIQAKRTVELETILNEGVKSGVIKKYSQDWFELRVQIEESKNKTNELNESVIKLQFEEKFDRAIKKADQYIDRLESINRLISSEMLYDSDRNRTDMWWLSLGLNSRSMAEEQGNLEKFFAKREEIIQKYNEGANDYFSDKTFDEMIEENASSIMSAFSNLNSYRESILDLIKNESEESVNALQKVIDKRKEALQKKKE